MKTFVAELLCDRAHVDGVGVMCALERARGMTPGALNSSVHLGPDLFDLPGVDAAQERLLLARLNGETVTVFGDYDVDGVTSCVQLVSFLRAFGIQNLRAYIPDRLSEDYGLKREAVDNCLELHNPGLIFTVDCGSSSREMITYLRRKGVDVIVLDHHQVNGETAHFPAVAHLNPKAHPQCQAAAQLMGLSAAGLAYLFCRRTAEKLNIGQWDHLHAAILAGLGTLADVMPLNDPINRALVKNSLDLANSHDIRRIPGLQVLAEVTGLRKFDPYAYGFVIGPHLNAAGRIATAQTAANLLATRDYGKAQSLVQRLVHNNAERKQTQESVLEEARQQALEVLLARPDAKALVLGATHWHPGVVGIVAARIREEHGRPTFVCGGAEDGTWKGSGRSVPGVDLGALVHAGKERGLIIDGGGHIAAAGIRFSPTKLSDLANFLSQACATLDPNAVRVYECWGYLDSLAPNRWLELYEKAEPFGQGHPRPNLLLQNAFLSDGPTALMKSDKCTAWAWKAKFTVPSGQSYEVTWADLDAATELWKLHGRYDLVVNLYRSTGRTGQVYTNCRVVACARAGAVARVAAA